MSDSHAQTAATNEARWRGHTKAPKVKRERTPEDIAATREKLSRAGKLAAAKRWEGHEKAVADSTESPKSSEEECLRVVADATIDLHGSQQSGQRLTRAERANGVLSRQLAEEQRFGRRERILELERRCKLMPDEETQFSGLFTPKIEPVENEDFFGSAGIASADVADQVLEMTVHQHRLPEN